MSVAAWLESALTPLASAVEKDAGELAAKAVATLLPDLTMDLTPIAQKAVDGALSGIPFGADLEGVANEAVATVVTDLVAAIQAALQSKLG